MPRAGRSVAGIEREEMAMADAPELRGDGCPQCVKFWTSDRGKALDAQITYDAGEYAASRHR